MSRSGAGSVMAPALLMSSARSKRGREAGERLAQAARGRQRVGEVDAPLFDLRAALRGGAVSAAFSRRARPINSVSGCSNCAAMAARGRASGR